MIRFIQKEYTTDQEILKAVLDDMMNEEKHVAEKYKDRPEKERKRSRRKYFDKKSQEQVERDNKRLDKKLREMGIEEQADTSFKTPSRPAPGKAPKEVKEIIKEKVAKKARKPINKKAIGLGTAGILGTVGAIYGADKYQKHRRKEQLRKEYREKFGLNDSPKIKQFSYREDIDRSHKVNKIAEEVIMGLGGLGVGGLVGKAAKKPGIGMLIGAASGVGLHKLYRKRIKAEEKEKSIKDQMEKEYYNANERYQKAINSRNKDEIEDGLRALDEMRSLKKDPAQRIMKNTSWIARNNK